MMQLYFFSVLMNLILGLSLVYGSNRSIPITETVRFKLFTGLISCLIGILTFFGSYPGSIAILGDLLPSVSAILGGVALLFDYYSETDTSKVSAEDSKPDKVETFFSENKRYIGILCLFASLLHFFFPKAVLL